MTTRLTRVDPLSFAFVSGVLYGLLSIIFVIIVAILMSFQATLQGGPPLALLVFLPILYAILGFIFGAITAFLYNIVAGWTGGVEITFEPGPTAA
jgi:hypothetical protein